MRIRLRFTKVGKIRFLGHRDLARCWERAIRRAELPMAYSEGFSPRPKLHYGLALPTGAESLAEYMDIDLATDIDIVGLDKLLSDGMPDGVALEKLHFEDIGGGRTRLVATSLVDSIADRDAFVASGMEQGVREGYERLDELLTR